MRFCVVLVLASYVMACGPSADDGQLHFDPEPAALPNPSTPPEKPVATVNENPDEEPEAVPVEAEEPTAPEPLEPVCVPSDCADVPLLSNTLAHPVVLAHGMGGFDEFGGFLEYWGGVQAALRNHGVATYTAVVDPLNGSDVRGEQLAGFIDRVLECTCADKVNIVGHSQGGIDIRVVVNAMGYGDRVASATSIATPHRGSAMAQILLELAPGEAYPFVDLVAYLFSEIYTDPLEQTNVRAALLWLSQEHLKAFDEEYPNDPKTAWYSYAGRAGLTAIGLPECGGAPLTNPKAHNPISPFLLPMWTLLGGLAGVDNDGLVTVDSAKWGEFRGCIPTDHMQEIGLGIPQIFDHVGFYVEHIDFLATQGH